MRHCRMHSGWRSKCLTLPVRPWWTTSQTQRRSTNTINMPVFFCNTVAHYLFIQQLFTDAPSYFARGKAGAHQLLTEFLTGKGTLAEKDWAWDELLAFLGMARLLSVNVLLSSYWTEGGCAPR